MGDNKPLVNFEKVPTPLRKVAEERGWGADRISRQIVASIIDYYTGNVPQTLELMSQDGWELELLPSVRTIRQMTRTREWQEALASRGEEISVAMHDGIAKVREVKAYLTQIMRSETASSRDKLQAAKLLGQAYSLFTDKKHIDMSGELSLQALLDEAENNDAEKE